MNFKVLLFCFACCLLVSTNNTFKGNYQHLYAYITEELNICLGEDAKVSIVGDPSSRKYHLSIESPNKSYKVTVI